MIVVVKMFGGGGGGGEVFIHEKVVVVVVVEMGVMVWIDEAAFFVLGDVEVDGGGREVMVVERWRARGAGAARGSA